MANITKPQRAALKAASQNDGRLWVLTPGWYTSPAPDHVDGPWPASTIRGLISSGLMIEVGDDVALTDAGREAVKD